MDYVVEVRDIFLNVILFQEAYEDANTANHEKRLLEEHYRFTDPERIQIQIIDPQE